MLSSIRGRLEDQRKITNKETQAQLRLTTDEEGCCLCPCQWPEALPILRWVCVFIDNCLCYTPREGKVPEDALVQPP